MEGVFDPADFIQSMENRPEPSIIESEGIPVIDLSGTDDRASLAFEIGEACKNWGFFKVINHGVPLKCQEQMELASRSFFALAKDEKCKVKKNEEKALGYYDTECTKNVRDWKELFDFTVGNLRVIPPSLDGDQDVEFKELISQWPVYPPKMREVCEEYGQEMAKLSFKLLELISLSLGLEADRLHGYFKDMHTGFIRLNHYPPCHVPDLALGLGAHTDSCVLTIVMQDDVGGLQVKCKADGGWIGVEPTPDAYVIFVGDVLQVWSNDKYESMEHRVAVNSKKDRFSSAFFMVPSHDTWVEPLKELQQPVDERNAAKKYKPYQWGKFATRRLSNFKT